MTDNGIPAESTLTRVIVKILDENDNRPQFLQKFYQIKLPEREKPERERTAKKEPIYRVVAADKDEGPNAEISYKIEDGNEHGKFFIDPITGVVSSKKYSGAGEYDILTVSLDFNYMSLYAVSAFTFLCSTVITAYMKRSIKSWKIFKLIATQTYTFSKYKRDRYSLFLKKNNEMFKKFM